MSESLSLRLHGARWKRYTPAVGGPSRLGFFAATEQDGPAMAQVSAKGQRFHAFVGQECWRDNDYDADFDSADEAMAWALDKLRAEAERRQSPPPAEART